MLVRPGNMPCQINEHYSPCRLIRPETSGNRHMLISRRGPNTNELACLWISVGYRRDWQFTCVHGKLALGENFKFCGTRIRRFEKGYTEGGSQYSLVQLHRRSGDKSGYVDSIRPTMGVANEFVAMPGYSVARGASQSLSCGERGKRM